MENSYAAIEERISEAIKVARSQKKNLIYVRWRVVLMCHIVGFMVALMVNLHDLNALPPILLLIPIKRRH